MLWTWSQALDTVAMNRRTVALVLVETILGVISVHIPHALIAINFGNNRRGADRRHASITTNDCLPLYRPSVKIKVWQAIAIDLGKTGNNPQPQ